jgi:hypothetical protein
MSGSMIRGKRMADPRYPRPALATWRGVSGVLLAYRLRAIDGHEKQKDWGGGTWQEAGEASAVGYRT